MKFLSCILVLLLLQPPEWLSDFDSAKQIARENNRLILLNFSGSDWCAPCIKMKKEVFSQEVFTTYASQYLVLVQADFPRSKKNQLALSQIKHNEELAEKYNPHGKFPYTLLLDSNGNIMQVWEGHSASAEEFIEQIQKKVQHTP